MCNKCENLINIEHDHKSIKESFDIQSPSLDAKATQEIGDAICEGLRKGLSQGEISGNAIRRFLDVLPPTFTPEEQQLAMHLMNKRNKRKSVKGFFKWLGGCR